MQYFDYRENKLYAEDVLVSDIAAEVGTPVFIYSRKSLEENYKSFAEPLSGVKHKICFAVKSNSNLAVLNILAKLGSGFDIVSKGELYRVLQAKGDPSKVVFSGVGKTADEIEYALKHNIFTFNIESVPELTRINNVAKHLNKTANISFRVNPNIDAQSHPYISTGLKENKFGIEYASIIDLYATAAKLSNINPIGINCHIGSQLTKLSPFMEALDKLIILLDKLSAAGFKVQCLNLGGGLGVSYKDETPPKPNEYLTKVISRLQETNYLNKLELVFEPGRVIAADAGILVTKLEYIKQSAEKNFYIVDAAMNDFARPALYSAYHSIKPLTVTGDKELTGDVVGPVCETSDFLGKERTLSVQPGEMLALYHAGAYGFTMSSNYNTRPRAAEVMVDGNKYQIVRAREELSELCRHENLLD